MHATNQRFTIDGSAALERHLAAICRSVLDGLHALLPASKLQAVILAGGYGRGQGGVLRTSTGDLPYNDVEFYVFLRGTSWLNARRFDKALQALAEQLSPAADVHIEFKIDSLAALRHRPISMFSYDLVAQHRQLFGNEETFCGCEHHLEPASLPTVEATRLLLNRCTGLLLARLLLAENSTLTAEQADFIGRNLAKLQLALGDAVLATFGFYHWNCLVRQQRLREIEPPESVPAFETIRKHHTDGVDFKLHPWSQKGTSQEGELRVPAGFRGVMRERRDAFTNQMQELSDLAFQLWVWLESRRLGRAFLSARDYAFSRLEKCRGTNKWGNYLLNLRTFGPKILISRNLDRYPRERLFNTLPLLLWCEPVHNEPEVLRRLQEQLMTKASDFAGWLAAYKQLWPNYG
jgi:hypothetical protein